jgi:4-amino-4-deoxy-L-arabinose transferase-like glycosyltransferase
VNVTEPVVVGRWTARSQARAASRVQIIASFAAILAAGTALRVWQLATRPGWQYDEGVYTWVGRSLLQHGRLAEHVPYGQPWSPFLYQPPFYFDVLARWFALTGPGIYHARILGVLCSLATLSLLFILLWRLHGPAAALLASAPIVLDGWLLYIQRISYIENMLLLLIVAGMLLYQLALERGTWQWFAAAGVLLGFAAAFKYTGVSAVAAVLLCWLILGRRHQGHLILLAAAAVTVTVYLWVMIRLYDSPGHSWFIHQTLVQVRRVLGLQSSGGTLNSPFKALHLLAAEYRVFLPSFAVAVASFVIGVRRLLACYRARDWEPLRGNALLFSWAATGIVIFGFSSLRFPQYFALILLPMYAYLWTELWHWDRRRLTLAAVAGVAVLAGLASFTARIGGYDDNVFAQAQTYAATQIPPRAVVIADEAVGDLIPQPYCREQDTGACAHRASYAITWKTYLQSSFALGDPAFHTLMDGAQPVRSFTGFNGTLTIWKLATTPAAPARPLVGIDVAANARYPLPAVRRYGQRVMTYIHSRLHAQAAGIIWDLCTPTFHASKIRPCTLTPAAVAILAGQAHAHGLQVQLRPLIRVGPPAGWNNPDRSWEGHIRPADPRAWFTSLERAERPYLRILATIPGAQFVIGTELTKIVNSPRWQPFIRQAQALCGCQVSIAVQDHQYKWGVVPPVPNPGVDWYPHMTLPATATQAAVTRTWEASLAAIPPHRLARTYLDEESIRGTAGAYHHPEQWGVGGPPAPQVQARYFTAACQTANHYHMRGLYFYMIPLNDDPASPDPFPAYFIGNQGAKAISDCARGRS